MNPYQFQNRQNQMPAPKFKGLQFNDLADSKNSKDINLDNNLPYHQEDAELNKNKIPKLMKYQLTKPNEYEEWQTVSQTQNPVYIQDQYSKFSGEFNEPIRVQSHVQGNSNSMRNIGFPQINHTNITQNNSLYSNFVQENDSLVHTLNEDQRLFKKASSKNDILKTKSEQQIIIHQKERNQSIEVEGLQNQDPDKLLEYNISNLKQKNINILESVKELEKENAIKILTDRLLASIAEKEDLQNTVLNLNSLLSGINKKYEEREHKLLNEIEILKEYAAKYSEDKFYAIEEENKSLKFELEKQKKLYLEMENQFRQENQELMHLYIDAEETKKHILDQLVQIKQSRDKIIQERKEIENEKTDLLRLKHSINREVADQDSFSNQSFTRDRKASEISAREKSEIESKKKKNATYDSEDSTYVTAINTRLQQLNKHEEDNLDELSREEENSNIARLRQVIANLQNFDAL